MRGVYRSVTRDTKAEARQWADELERQIRTGEYWTGTGHTLREAYDRYARETGADRRRWDRNRLARLSRDPSADVPLAELTPAHMAALRDRLLERMKASSVNRELNQVSGVLSKARREWGWIKNNPLSQVDRPRDPPPRDRRISDDETNRVLNALGWAGEVRTKQHEVAVIWLLALETAMRFGELSTLCWENVRERHVVLEDTKNGDRRYVPLSSRARELFELVPGEGEQVFSVSAASASTLARKAIARAGIENLRPHDTRHEAITRLARKIDIMDLARMVGHRDLRSLKIYYNPTADEIADRLG